MTLFNYIYLLCIQLRSIHRPVWYIPTPDERDIERVMLWTEYQAYVLQVKQIGKSACGATSVANALVSSSGKYVLLCYRK